MVSWLFVLVGICLFLGAVFLLFSSSGVLRFCGFARAGFRLWDWFGGLKFCRTYGAFLSVGIFYQGFTPLPVLFRPSGTLL